MLNGYLYWKRIVIGSRRTPLVFIVVLNVMLPCAAVSISWKVVNHAGQAIPVFRNSHSTAVASFVKYHGLQKQNESDKPLIATCWMYAQYCECDKKDKPIIWRISHGLKKLFTARGYPNSPIKERCRYSNESGEKAGWDDYTAAINDDRPVILSFCYDSEASKGLARAREARQYFPAETLQDYSVWRGEPAASCQVRGSQQHTVGSRRNSGRDQRIQQPVTSNVGNLGSYAWRVTTAIHKTAGTGCRCSLSCCICRQHQTALAH